jgi:hypothetical protein
MAKNANNGEPDFQTLVGKHPEPASKANQELTDDGKIVGSRSRLGRAGRQAKASAHLEAMVDDAERVNAAEAEAAAAGKPPKRPLKPKAGTIELPPLEILLLDLTIVGDAPLICHAWSKKAIEQMLGRQMGTPSAGRENKDPERDFEESLYSFPGGGYGFPTIAFKNAAVTACTSLGKSVTKVAARQAFHVVGELARIEGVPNPRQDMVRVGQGIADVRFRGEFPEWRTTIRVRHNSRVLNASQIVNLFNTAGFAVGIGEWRPERDGAFGLFHVSEVVQHSLPKTK